MDARVGGGALTAEALHGGRFQLVSALGEGGFGKVYEAYDRSRRAKVALKALTRLGPDALVRFKREFRVLQDLAHPNLVSLGELFESDGQWFFTMELVPGADFMTFVRPTSTRCDEARLRAAALQLAEGLSALHGANTIHRDIKPSNVRVTPEGRVVILDFGLVTFGDEARQSTAGAVLGSIAYMAPEQAAGGKLGPAADFYAMGSVLYEALTGKLPFTGTPIEMLLRKQHQLPSPPSTHAPSICADLEALCMALMRPDPAQRPTGPEIIARLRGTTVSMLPSALRDAGDAPSTFVPPFLGRERELERLAQAADQAEERELTAMYVHGPSGIGKSALVHQFTNELGARDAHVLALEGRCYERESVPYKAFDGIMEELSRHLRRLPPDACSAVLPRRAHALTNVFPVLTRVEAIARTTRDARGPVDPRTQRDEAFKALREMLGRLAARMLVVIVIDDWQWADADSVALLDSLIAQPDAPECLILCTGRDPAECREEIQASIERLCRVSASSGLLRVGRLEPEAARELSLRLLTRYGGDAAMAEAVADEANGQPLFIDELARHVASQRERAATPDLDAMIRARVEVLEPDTRHVLEVLAVGGPVLPQEITARAAGLDGSALGRSITVLKLARLVRTGQQHESPTVEIFHDRVRQVVKAALSEAPRRALHAALAGAFESDGAADPAVVAWHWVEAGEADRAAHHALRASDRTGDALAFERAAALYRRVLEHRPELERRRKLLVKLGETLANAGRGAEAAEAFMAALDGAAPEEALELRRRAAQELIQTGHVDRGLAEAHSVLAAVDVALPKTPAAALRSLIWQRAMIAMRGFGFQERDASEVPAEELRRIDVLWAMTTSLFVVDHIRAAELHSRLLRSALASGEPSRVARVLAMEAAIVRAAGSSREKVGRKCVEQARALSERLGGDPHVLGLISMAEGIMAYGHGHFREAARRCEEASIIFRERCVGVAWERNNADYFAVLSLYQLGEIHEVARRVPRLLEDAERRGDLYALANLRLTGSYYLALVSDRLDEARDEIEVAMREWSVAGFHVQHFLEMSARGSLLLYAGGDERVREAFDMVEGAWPDLVKSQLLRAETVAWVSHWVRARVALAAARVTVPKRVPRLLRVVERSVRALSSMEQLVARGLGAAMGAGLAAARGERERERQLLVTAEELLARAETALLHESVCLRLSEAQGDAEGALRACDALRERGVADPIRCVRAYIY